MYVSYLGAIALVATIAHALRGGLFADLCELFYVRACAYSRYTYSVSFFFVSSPVRRYICIRGLALFALNCPSAWRAHARVNIYASKSEQPPPLTLVYCLNYLQVSIPGRQSISSRPPMIICSNVGHSQKKPTIESN